MLLHLETALRSSGPDQGAKRHHDVLLQVVGFLGAESRQAFHPGQGPLPLRLGVAVNGFGAVTLRALRDVDRSAPLEVGGGDSRQGGFPQNEAFDGGSELRRRGTADHRENNGQRGDSRNADMRAQKLIPKITRVWKFGSSSTSVSWKSGVIVIHQFTVRNERFGPR